MAYDTPPTADPKIATTLNLLTRFAAEESADITQRMLSKALINAQVTSPKIHLEALIQMVELYIIPTIQKLEGGWFDDPTDGKEPAMKGVFLSTLVAAFDTIFIESTPKILVTSKTYTLALNWNNQQKSWKTDPALSKVVLYTLLSNPKVAGLFFYYFLASESSRYPIAIMTEDPFLGYFLADAVWSSGANVFSSAAADFDSLAKSKGWNGNVSTWASFMIGLGENTPTIATEAIVYRYKHIIKLTTAEDQKKYREPWLNRLMSSDDSNLIMLVRINELFNSGGNEMFIFSDDEKKHLEKKALTYKKLIIEIPG
jgi:hypothetical protein